MAALLPHALFRVAAWSGVSRGRLPSRRRNKGRHQVVPLHADIAVRARRIGFDYLTPIYWQKIANASYEVENGSSFLGKPFEPNAILKNDTEYILMLRKSGGYRKPTEAQRVKSKMTKDEYNEWFRSLWTDYSGRRPKPIPHLVSGRTCVTSCPGCFRLSRILWLTRSRHGIDDDGSNPAG